MVQEEVGLVLCGANDTDFLWSRKWLKFSGRDARKNDQLFMLLCLLWISKNLTALSSTYFQSILLPLRINQSFFDFTLIYTFYSS
jgi:hypothetical protein